MPPAFNLSQDQTLQFDLSRFHHSLDSTPPRPLDEKRNGNTVGNLPVTNRTSVVRVRSTSGKPPKLARHKTPAPRGPRLSTHTYRLPIVKERAVPTRRVRSYGSKEARL